MIELDAPIGDLMAAIPATVGVLDSIDDKTTMLTTGSDRVESLAFHVLSLGVGFRVVECDALRQHLAELVARAGAATATAALEDGEIRYGR